MSPIRLKQAIEEIEEARLLIGELLHELSTPVAEARRKAAWLKTFFADLPKTQRTKAAYRQVEDMEASIERTSVLIDGMSGVFYDRACSRLPKCDAKDVVNRSMVSAGLPKMRYESRAAICACDERLLEAIVQTLVHEHPPPDLVVIHQKPSKGEETVNLRFNYRSNTDLTRRVSRMFIRILESVGGEVLYGRASITIAIPAATTAIPQTHIAKPRLN